MSISLRLEIWRILLVLVSLCNEPKALTRITSVLNKFDKQRIVEVDRDNILQ